MPREATHVGPCCALQPKGSGFTGLAHTSVGLRRARRRGLLEAVLTEKFARVLTCKLCCVSVSVTRFNPGFRQSRRGP